MAPTAPNTAAAAPNARGLLRNQRMAAITREIKERGARTRGLTGAPRVEAYRASHSTQCRASRTKHPVGDGFTGTKRPVGDQVQAPCPSDPSGDDGRSFCLII